MCSFLNITIIITAVLTLPCGALSWDTFRNNPPFPFHNFSPVVHGIMILGRGKVQLSKTLCEKSRGSQKFPSKVFATVGNDVQFFRVYGRSHYVANGTTTAASTAVLEDCNAQQAESETIDSFPVGLRTYDLMAVCTELKAMLMGCIHGLATISIFPIMMTQAQPVRDSHRLGQRWHPFIPNNVAQNVRRFPRPGPREQPARDQLVPEVHDTAEFPQTRSQLDDHVVPVVVDESVFHRREEPWHGEREQVVPGFPGYGQDEDFPHLQTEEPSFDLEANQVVPNELPDSAMSATDGPEVADPFLQDLQRILSTAAGITMPWAEVVRYFCLCGNDITEEKLARFRAQIQVLDSMPTVLNFHSHNDKNPRV